MFMYILYHGVHGLDISNVSNDTIAIDIYPICQVNVEIRS